MSYSSSRLGDITKIKTGRLDANASSDNGQYPFFTCAKQPLKISSFSYDCECVLVAGNGDLNVKYYNGKFDAYQRTYIIESTDKNKLDARYLYYFVDSYLEKLRKQSIGGIIKYIKLGNLTEIQIPLPPLSEQKRIVQILDKADELRQKRQQSIEKLDELLQATFIDMFGDPLTNQKNWEISKLVNEIELIQIGPFGTQLHQEDYVENSIPLINPSHIRNGKIFPDNKLTVSEEKYHQLPQYHMKTNDVIVGRRGEMGRCAVVTERENGYFCGTGSLFLRMNEKNLNATFLSFILSSNSIKKLLENSSQGVTMANLNKKIVSEIPLIMPNIDLQSKFGEFVDSINLQKQRLKVQSKQQENLFQSLQQRAFNGEL